MNRLPPHVRFPGRPRGFTPWLQGLLLWALGFSLILLAWPVATPSWNSVRVVAQTRRLPVAPAVTEATGVRHRNVLPQWSGALWILDDLGLDPRQRRHLLSLPRWVIFSVLPYGPDAPLVARAACDQGRTVLIHLPMEPLNPRVDPGPDAIRAGMDQNAVARILDRARARVPCAVGLNQHMGSRAARDLATMRTVVRSAARVGLRLFIDSRTAGGSQLCTAAWQLGYTCYPRDLFLDATRDRARMIRRWVVSFRHKPVDLPLVVIMHPYPQTLQLLQDLARARGPSPILSMAAAPVPDRSVPRLGELERLGPDGSGRMR